MLDFRMETFLTVCQCMNYTRASEQLNITQPAVSQHIRFLEKYYQTKLFVYEDKQMKLTEAGEMLRSAAAVMKQEEVLLRARMLRQDGIKDLHLGASPAVGESVMADILRRCMERYPKTKVSMEVADTQKLLERVDIGKVDFVLADGNFRPDAYELLPFSKEKLVAVCSAKYFEKNLLKMPRTLEDLLGERILIRESESGTRQTLDRFLYANNHTVSDFTSMMEIGDIHTIIELAKAGFGIAFLFEHSVRKLIEEGKLIRLDIEGFQPEQAFTFLWRKGSIYTEIYREMFEEMAEIS